MIILETTHINNKNIDREKNKLDLEKKLAATLWLQVIGQVGEAIILTKLLMLEDDSEGEKKIALGQWIQTIGQIFEALGTTKQIQTVDKELILEAQKLAINGDTLQSIGAGLQVIGGKEVITEEILTKIQEFIP